MKADKSTQLPERDDWGSQQEPSYFQEGVFDVLACKELADTLFPLIDKSPEFYEKRYPKRPENEVITRYAPSPTGFMHIGNFYTAYISERIAHQNNWKFLLRIEDTDKEREVPEAINVILSVISRFWIHNDEGAHIDAIEDIGEYWPYTQSLRKDIYITFIKDLIAKGRAYPCFMTKEEISSIRLIQEEKKVPTGVYWAYSKWREASMEDIKSAVSQGWSYVIRLRSPGIIDNKVEVHDEIRGKLFLSENFQDIVLLKTDGLPTYHLAHVVDDHLMRTTHVVRSDEWLPSLPLHTQLFQIFRRGMPEYLHVSPILKEEDGKKRKISKRKDPEANLDYFAVNGYPEWSLKEYLMTIIDSWYEVWKRENPNTNQSEYKFDYTKMSKSGALFDEQKLASVSQEYMNTLSLDDFLAATQVRASKYHPLISSYLAEDTGYFKSVIGIDALEGKGLTRYSKFKDIENLLFFFDAEYNKLKPWIEDKIKDITDDLTVLIHEFLIITPYENKLIWFETFKSVCEKHWYVANKKLFIEWVHRGLVSEVAGILKLMLTWSDKAPDLFGMMQVMWKERVSSRIYALIS